jgi:catechol 2,3-dioxygenase-like lactoylglutathione lyase family enzyme
MIKGVHTMFYTSEAEALRAFFRDKLGFPCVDVGEGWLIFDLPPADLGCHPIAPEDAESVPSGTADISFLCDDIEGTVRDLESKGVEFADTVHDAGYARRTYFKVPGGFTIQLYEPKYSK